MLKVLIADDEKKVCKLIQMLCDWEAYDMELVGFAYNGVQALEMINIYQPDILITDIRMPGCDGIEIIKKIRSRAVSLEIVIISGYADFDYAQSAIRYGVSDYLLKPIKQQELQNTLLEIKNRCQQESARRDASHRLMQYIENDKLKKRCNIFYDLLLAVPQRIIPEIEILNVEYAYHFKAGVFRIIILKLDYNMEKYDAQGINFIMKSIEETIQSALNSCCYDCEICSDGNTSYIMCNYAEEDRHKFRQIIRGVADQIVIKRFQLRENCFTLGMGREVKECGDLFLSLEDARNAVKERLLEGNNRLLEAPLISGKTDFSDLVSIFNHNCSKALDLLDEQMIHDCVSNLNRELFSMEYLTGSGLLNIVHSVGIHALTAEKNGDYREQIANFMEKCDLCSSSNQLFTVLEDMLRHLIQNSKQQKEEEGRRPIRVAKQYIQNHYTEPITLKIVAEKAGFSSNYFSSVFKKETGIGFAEYVEQLRMEKAKELLKGSKTSIKDICALVGYSDLKHFTVLFRKYTSMKPGEFRKLYG